VLGLVALFAACAPDGEAPAPPPAASRAPDGFGPVRERMVHTQIWGRGVRDRAVLEAMRTVPRHRFVPERLLSRAYGDHPLPIGEDQTISQPYIVASMTEELAIERGMKVLEIGTGSGYQAAVLAELTPLVFSIEIKKPLHERATAVLKELEYASVRTRLGDGYFGWPEEAPFDAIMVTAAAPHVPPPLVEQLKPGGRLILPVGPTFATQDLRLVEKGTDGRVRTKSMYPVRFVPLTGSLGK